MNFQWNICPELQVITLFRAMGLEGKLPETHIAGLHFPLKTVHSKIFQKESSIATIHVQVLLLQVC